MNESPPEISVALRIPGKWAHPRELIEQLPADCRFTPEALVLPDGAKVEFNAVEADDRFAGVFRSACRRPPSESERAIIDDYTVNVLLRGPGGSLDAARTMMQAGAAIVRAGGAGVFIDNSALAHGGDDWVEMADDGGPDALSFAFAAIVGGRTEVYTMGMQVLGLRDVVMKRADLDANEDFDIVEVIRYLARSEKPIENAHILADLNGPRYQAFTEADPERRGGSPMHNPFGRLRLVSMKDIAEKN